MRFVLFLVAALALALGARRLWAWWIDPRKWCLPEIAPDHETNYWVRKWGEARDAERAAAAPCLFPAGLEAWAEFIASLKL